MIEKQKPGMEVNKAPVDRPTLPPQQGNGGRRRPDMDALWNALKGCGLTASIPDAVALEKILDEGPRSAQFTQLVSNLSKALCLETDLEEQVNCPADLADVSAFMLELSSLLKEMSCPYNNLIEGPSSSRLSTKVARYNLVNFLCSELEASQILSEAKKHSGNLDEGKSSQSVKEKADGVSKDDLGYALFQSNLSAERWDIVNRMNEQMRADYKLRREMLNKRFDVTISSFLWSDRVKKKENDVMRLYKPLRSQLRRECHITVADLLAARNDLAHIEKTSGPSVRAVTKSKLNKLLIQGKMPDRGGRPTEIERPPPEMPSWSQRKPADRAGRVQSGWSSRGSNWNQSPIGMGYQPDYSTMQQYGYGQNYSMTGSMQGGFYDSPHNFNLDQFTRQPAQYYGGQVPFNEHRPYPQRSNNRRFRQRR
ncbi:protein FAM98A [Trichuris trichiura]|uniref:Protein FAM98A n=1 Tax=Trichuris trichiura TaxID=36087 RepID=A0A077Z0N7_TRITR|nr:protein FAM98A [Trichuris trichiura]